MIVAYLYVFSCLFSIYLHPDAPAIITRNEYRRKTTSTTITKSSDSRPSILTQQKTWSLSLLSRWQVSAVSHDEAQAQARFRLPLISAQTTRHGHRLFSSVSSPLVPSVSSVPLAVLVPVVRKMCSSSIFRAVCSTPRSPSPVSSPVVLT